MANKEEDYYDVRNLPEDIQEILKKELGENDRIRNESLIVFRDWVEKQKYVKNCRTDTPFLLRFLRLKKFSVMRAQEGFLAYFGMKVFCPFYKDLNPRLPGIDHILDQGIFFTLRERDSEGRIVCFTRFGPGLLGQSSDDIWKTFIMCLETISSCETLLLPGSIHFYDFSNLSLKYLPMAQPKLIYHFGRISKSYTFMRVKKVVAFNVNSKLVAMHKTFVSWFPEKLQKRAIIGSDNSTLHELIPKKHLPKEYGGEIPIKDLIDDWKKIVKDRQVYLKMYDDTSLGEDWKNTRVNKELAGDGYGIEGTFRKLEID